MRILLDANAYSLLEGGDDGIADLVRRAEEVLLSAIVVGELLYGFRRGSRFEENLSKLRSFLDRPIRHARAGGAGDGRPLLQNRDIAESQGPAHPGQRYVDRGARHGDGSRSRVGRRALRARRRACVDSCGGELGRTRLTTRSPLPPSPRAPDAPCALVYSRRERGGPHVRDDRAHLRVDEDELARPDAGPRADPVPDHVGHRSAGAGRRHGRHRPLRGHLRPRRGGCRGVSGRRGRGTGAGLRLRVLGDRDLLQRGAGGGGAGAAARR